MKKWIGMMLFLLLVFSLASCERNIQAGLDSTETLGTVSLSDASHREEETETTAETTTRRTFYHECQWVLSGNSTETEHEYRCTVSYCRRTKKEEHCGGVATCLKMAECEICGSEYESEGDRGHVYVQGECMQCHEREKGEGLRYTRIGDCYEVAGLGTCPYDEIEISSVYYGLPVIGIRMAAFSGKTTLKSVQIPDGIEYIGSMAFRGCEALSEITIPKSVNIIFDSAFQRCTSLSRVTLFDGLDGILSYAFADCTSLTEIIIPGTVQAVTERAFRNCTSLSKVILSEGVQSLGRAVFEDCTALSNILIPASVAKVGSHLFSGCVNLKAVVFKNGCSGALSYTFKGCRILSYVVIPHGIQSLDEKLFEDCIALRQLNFAGTRAQWVKIKNWDKTPYDIICSDGVLTKEMIEKYK